MVQVSLCAAVRNSCAYIVNVGPLLPQLTCQHFMTIVWEGTSWLQGIYNSTEAKPTNSRCVSTHKRIIVGVDIKRVHVHMILWLIWITFRFMKRMGAQCMYIFCVWLLRTMKRTPYTNHMIVRTHGPMASCTERLIHLAPWPTKWNTNYANAENREFLFLNLHNLINTCK